MARPLIALDTATSTGGIAVGRGPHVFAEVILGEAGKHSENLLPAIEFALSRAGCRKGDVAGVVVGAGPGSFTGVRIAAATAKALVHAWGVPLHAWSSLAMLAAGCPDRDRPIVPLFDARRDEVYAACYRFRGDGLSILLAPAALPIAELLARIEPQEAVFLGEGAILHEGKIRDRGGVVISGPATRPRPSALLWLVDLDPTGGLVAEPGRWEPEYIRASGAQRMREP